MSWSRPEYRRLAEKLQTHAGFVFSENRRKSTEIHMATAMKESGFDDLVRFEASINRDEIIFRRFIDHMVIGETYFQREQSRLDFVKNVLLPQLREQRSSQHCFKIWSAGCSTGEEAYTLAALMIEAGLKNRFQITATDISANALLKAKTGQYSKWSFRGVEEKFVTEYFDATANGGWLVKPILRENVSFKQLNLMDSNIAHDFIDLTGLDLIFCRNVLIYFNPESVARLSYEFFHCLSTGGWLVTGASDPQISPEAGFNTIVRDEGTFHTKPTAQASKIQAQGNAIAKDSQSMTSASSSSLVRLTTAIANMKPEISMKKLAEEYFREGKWQSVLDVLGENIRDEKLISLAVHSYSNLRKIDAAERLLSEGLDLFPHSIELLFLHSMMFLEKKEYLDALQILKKIAYLDRSIAAVFLTMAFIQETIGDSAAALRSYRNTINLCTQTAPEKLVLFDTKLTAESLTALANAGIEKLSNRGLVSHER